MVRQIENQIPGWVIDIKEGPDYDSGGSWTIYRVPRSMREVYRNAFVPKIISVGPFHFRDEGLNVMEEHKMRYLLRLLGGPLQENGEHQEEPVPQVRKAIRLEELADAMRVLEQNTRERYSEAFDHISSDDFVKMMVVDGCFVVELLRLYYKFNKEKNVDRILTAGSIRQKKVDDPIFTTRWMLRTLQRDLLMLENQLPFFVLEKLFELTSLPKEPSLIDLTLTFFDPLLPRKDNKPKLNHEEEFDHMLDVFRSTFLSSVEDNPLVKDRQIIDHCVMELQEAGVKFKKRKDSDLLDINFEKRELQIPPLDINDDTVPLFLNFVAYEQCDRDAKPFFTAFFVFFDSLINSPKDVKFLHKNDIINHNLGSDQDVANLFNKLCREIVYDLDDCYLSKQMKGVNDYYDAYYAKEWHVWWTNLKRDYFSSPWTFLSLLAAIVLLILTVAQTSYAMLAYYRSLSS